MSPMRLSLPVHEFGRNVHADQTGVHFHASNQSDKVYRILF